MYSRRLTFVIHLIALTLCRLSYFIAIILLIIATCNGTKSTIIDYKYSNGMRTPIVADSITPEPELTLIAFKFGVFWFLATGLFLLLGAFLPCDHCGTLYARSKYYCGSDSPTCQRNNIIRFFILDELVDGEFMCPSCKKIFKLK
jgi:hypothetical protein